MEAAFDILSKRLEVRGDRPSMLRLFGRTGTLHSGEEYERK
jgi:hypothetical protein